MGILAAALRRVAEVVAAFFLQWLPVDAASFANFPWGGGGSSSGETPDTQAGNARGKRARGSRRRSSSSKD